MGFCSPAKQIRRRRER